METIGSHVSEPNSDITIEQSAQKYFHYPHPFQLEAGDYLPEFTLAYHTYGKLNEAKDNVVWVVHALTGSSDPVDWWPGIVGKDCVIDIEKHFIVCANCLGSPYGST